MMTPGNFLNSSFYFWWLAPILFLFQCFWWVFLLAIVIWVPFLRIWWWFFLPIILYFPLRKIYLYWLEWDIWYKETKWIVLEIIPPKEIEKPFKAMEDVLEVLWPIYDSPNWREVWCEGALPFGSGTWFSFEIVSLGGKIHFYARMPEGFRGTFESSFYAHYPELEIRQVPDYVKNVPLDIPNEKFDISGEDYCFINPHCYPIKTYPTFFEERGEMVKEEKRIDPINSLLESMAKLKEGEQFWFQIIPVPVIDEIPWKEEGKKIAAKIARREAEKKGSVLQREIQKMAEPPHPILRSPGEKAVSPARTEEGGREMIITPRERAVLSAIENKMSKIAFSTTLRGLLIFEKDKPYNKGNSKIARTYLMHFKVTDLNTIRFWDLTRVRIQYILRNRRLYLRKRKLFRNYVQRFPPLWPEMEAGKATPILNTEEIATIFHFPTKIILPTVPRIEAKPGGPPPGLPVE